MKAVIIMRAPKFWYPVNSNEKTWQASLLGPFSSLYQHFYDKRVMQATAYKASIPVICVGNAVAGGGGKTPTALYLYQLINQSKQYDNPVILLRGYKGKESGPLLVSNLNTAKEIGDEAVLLAQYASVIIAKDKVEGVKFAESEGFDCLIMDDGYQNPHVEKTINILVIDERGFGNGRLIPAGPLREPADEAIEKADIIISKEQLPLNVEELLGECNKPVFIGRYKVETKLDQKADYIAFSGIAHPEKFLHTLEQENLNIIEFYPYPDHYAFTQETIERLKTIAHEHGKNTQLITTEKDWVRLADADKKEISYLKIALDLDDDREFEHLFLEMLKGDLS